MKKNKLVKIFLVISLFILILGGCSGKRIEEDNTIDKTNSEVEIFKVGLIVGTGGLGDQNFNDLAYEGLEKAKKELGIEFDYSEPQSASEYSDYITQYAEDGSYDLIMLNASEAEAALIELAPKYPEQKFSIIDTYVDEENVISLVKDFRHYTFISGYLAGAMTQDVTIKNMNEDNVVGIVICVDSPVMQEAAMGFQAGAKLANAETDVRVGIAGSFGDPATAKEITRSIYDGGGDIVMALAGGSSLGVVNQAKESSLYAIGCTTENVIDSAPENVIGSALESLDSTVYSMCEDLINGNLESGIVYLGIENGYFVFTFGNSNVPVQQKLKDQIAEIVSKIEKGELKLPEFPASESEIDKWVNENLDYAYKK